LTVHEEKGQNIVIREGCEEEDQEKIDANTKLTAFFNLCAIDTFAKQFRYDQIPYYYRFFLFNILFLTLNYLVGTTKKSAGKNAKIHCKQAMMPKCLCAFFPCRPKNQNFLR